MGSRLAVALLRSPLHRLRSREIAITVGDRSVAVPFSRVGDSLTVLGSPADEWWRVLAAEGTTPVEVHLAGASRAGEARFVAGDELDQALLPYLQAHPAAWRDLSVAPDASTDDVAAAAQRAAVIVIDLTPA